MKNKELVNLLYESKKLGMVQVDKEIIQLVTLLDSYNTNYLPINNILEIGTKLGGTFNMFAAICNKKAISVDLPGGEYGGFLTKDHPYFHNVIETRNNYFENKYPDKTHFISGNSHSRDTFRKVKRILNKEKIDFLFLDGDHTYEGVKKDFDTYLPLMNERGIIAIHDINDTEHHRNIGVNVGEFWNRLLDYNYFGFIYSENKHWGGIGIIIL